MVSLHSRKTLTKRVGEIRTHKVANTSYILIKKEVGNSLECIAVGNDFLNRTPITQALRSTINKWDLMKHKSFYKAKDTIIHTVLTYRM